MTTLQQSIILCTAIFSLSPVAVFTQTEKIPVYVEFGALQVRTNGLQYQKGGRTPFTGVSVEFYPDGTKRNIRTWKKGLQDGPLIIWHEETCRKKEEVHYLDGLIDGITLEWFANGQLKSLGHYEEGKKNGLFITWHENGQWASGVIYKEDQPAGLTMEKKADGSILQELLYRDGKILKAPTPE